MCGISGLWNFDGAPVAPAVLQNMNALLAHRGPDGSGIYRDGALGLGYPRFNGMWAFAIWDARKSVPCRLGNGCFTASYASTAWWSRATVTAPMS